MRTTTRQSIVGTVVSDKMDKTVVVQVETLIQHPRYKKYVRRRKRYKAHDPESKCELGDVVRCMGIRPISKDKKWLVTDIIRKKYVSTQQIKEVEEMVMKKEKVVIKKQDEIDEVEEVKEDVEEETEAIQEESESSEIAEDEETEEEVGSEEADEEPEEKE